MIISFRHKGLKRLYDGGSGRGLPANSVDRIQRILSRLDIASKPSDMDLPGLRLHPLKGQLRGYWAVDVTGNWRVIFRFGGTDACDVDLVDYH